jgi:hypothetical protein
MMRELLPPVDALKYVKFTLERLDVMLTSAPASATEGQPSKP